MDKIQALKDIIKDLQNEINLEEDLREMNKKITFLIDKKTQIKTIKALEQDNRNLIKTLKKLEQENKELVEILKRLEYRVEKDWNGTIYAVCPICGRREYTEHRSDCALGKLLEKYKDEE